MQRNGIKKKKKKVTPTLDPARFGELPLDVGDVGANAFGKDSEQLRVAQHRHLGPRLANHCLLKLLLADRLHQIIVFGTHTLLI
jgi:hypothetical protein